MFLSRVWRRFKALFPDERVRTQQYEELHLFLGNVRETVTDAHSDLTTKHDALANEIHELSRQLESVRAITSQHYDRIIELRQQLLAIRETQEYVQLYQESEPLVTVRIPTYNNVDLLIERAIASVQRQTYSNWEIVVVGDHCTDETQEKIAALKDDRIRFFNFPYRNVYPQDPHDRWQVAGSPGMNKGVEMAQGSWIAPLDDDDEFSPDHIELLLSHALKYQYEMVYGSIKQLRLATNEEKILDKYPPEKSFITGQACMYPKLLKFFEWDTASWVVDEPGDWNFVRRMMEAGVSIGKVDDIVTTIYSADPGTKS